MVETVYKTIEPLRESDVVKWEIDSRFLSREQATLLAGSGADRKVVLGEVLGKVLFDADVTVTAGGGNTGNGTVTGDALLAAAKLGTYTATCIAAATNGGRFQVVDPDGYRLPDALVGTAYATQIAFTINDGATDFAVGDTFDLVVAAGSGKLVALAPSAVDGSQRAYGIALRETTAPDGVDAKLPVLKGFAVAASGRITWPAGISADAKAAAIAELAAKSITLATEA